MKTRDLAETLNRFADLAVGDRAHELRKLAHAFADGKDGTVAIRLKKMSPAQGHPAGLRASLKAVHAGLVAAGAKKQASDIEAILKTFRDPANLAIDEFVEQITRPQVAPAKKSSPKPPSRPDHVLAREIADDLVRTAPNVGEFNRVVGRLLDAKKVNSPTLAVVANRFLGNSKKYKGRKAAIDDIVNRQKADAREDARGRALSRVGV